MAEQRAGRSAGDYVVVGPLARVVGDGDEGLAGADQLRGRTAERHERFAHRRYEHEIHSGGGQRMNGMCVEQITADGDHKVPTVVGDVDAQLRPTRRLDVLDNGPIGRRVLVVCERPVVTADPRDGGVASMPWRSVVLVVITAGDEKPRALWPAYPVAQFMSERLGDAQLWYHDDGRASRGGACDEPGPATRKAGRRMARMACPLRPNKNSATRCSRSHCSRWPRRSQVVTKAVGLGVSTRLGGRAYGDGRQSRSCVGFDSVVWCREVEALQHYRVDRDDEARARH